MANPPLKDRFAAVEAKVDCLIEKVVTQISLCSVCRPIVLGNGRASIDERLSKIETENVGQAETLKRVPPLERRVSLLVGIMLGSGALGGVVGGTIARFFAG